MIIGQQKVDRNSCSNGGKVCERQRHGRDELGRDTFPAQSYLNFTLEAQNDFLLLLFNSISQEFAEHLIYV